MNIVAVFDELKDYLSESDLDRSLDYKIALRRKKNRTQSLKQNTSNYPNKMAGYDNYGESLFFAQLYFSLLRASSKSFKTV